MTPLPGAEPLSPVTTVVLDYGEVVSVPPPAAVRARLVELSTAPAEEFWDAYWGERRAYDSGISAHEYWDRVGARLGVSWPPAVRQELWATDMGGWLLPDPGVAALVARLAAGPTRLALLSNAPHDLAAVLRSAPLLHGFDALFFSCEIGLCKPDPAVYGHVLRELGAEPGETLFVDDREENVRAAARLGIRAHRHTGTRDLAALLDRVLEGGPVSGG
ncbi:HAD family hydrolase [Thermobifida cellulosilytica]|uniref:HAD family hydrolase n=1 Tax=Thermobifida cellulosilytica TB100 TaxID=665004 RepID=A0A147KHL1_THECS|nr:HAD family phosphatase [Thermobifida cellulosilytica]KUP96783.1 HAD family hydrolase [Thermobifida cellulosilytica TB100]